VMKKDHLIQSIVHISQQMNWLGKKRRQAQTQFLCSFCYSSLFQYDASGYLTNRGSIYAFSAVNVNWVAKMADFKFPIDEPKFATYPIFCTEVSEYQDLEGKSEGKLEDNKRQRGNGDK
ncbi:hypothetical protein LOAG_02209, partial [Loa loa]